MGDGIVLLARTCDRCACSAEDCVAIEDAYICAACRAEIAADEAEIVARYLRGAESAARKWKLYCPPDAPPERMPSAISGPRLGPGEQIEVVEIRPPTDRGAA